MSVNEESMIATMNKISKDLRELRTLVDKHTLELASLSKKVKEFKDQNSLGSTESPYHSGYVTMNAPIPTKTKGIVSPSEIMKRYGASDDQ